MPSLLTRRQDIEEKVLPNGQWERVYHGKDVAAAVGELRQAADESRETKAKEEMVPVRMGSGPPTAIRRDFAEKRERNGQLRPIHEVLVSGFGDGRPGCDSCGRTAGGLRYIEGHGFLCKSRCLRRVA